MRELDRIAIEELSVPSYELMARAAEATFDLIQVNWQECGSLCVVCGAGNNGGDGYVIARLALQGGWVVNVVGLTSIEHLSGDARRACNDYVQAGGAIGWLDDEAPKAYTVIVDALLGTGLRRDVTGRFADAIRWMNQHPAPVIAVDIPSGLQANTGQVCGCVVNAEMTMTYIGTKQGLLTGQARNYVGELHFDDLGVTDEMFQRLGTDQYIIAEEYILTLLAPRAPCTHKGSFGHALLVGGAEGMSGAIRLAGEAGLRSGCGLMTIATHPSHSSWLNLTRPELMVIGVSSASQLREMLAGKAAVGIGPGLGQDKWALQLLLVAMDCGVPLVLDADALNLLATMNRRQDNWVLTPHPAEAARLLGWETAEVEQDRVYAVECLQRQYGGVCILKGAGTLVKSGLGTAFCTKGNPGMASGGMGDVLTGIITGLLAQGLSLSNAACLGVQVHAVAADQAAIVGERGLLASDVIEQIRSVVNP